MTSEGLTRSWQRSIIPPRQRLQTGISISRWYKSPFPSFALTLTPCHMTMAHPMDTLKLLLNLTIFRPRSSHKVEREVGGVTIEVTDHSSQRVRVDII